MEERKMIYGIKVKQYILREIAKQIDREGNLLFIKLLIDVFYGSEWSSSTASVRRSAGSLVEKRFQPELWALLKDANNETVLGHVYETIDEYLEAYAAFLAYEKNPEYEEVAQGEGRDPIQVRKANPHAGVIDALSNTIFGQEKNASRWASPRFFFGRRLRPRGIGVIHGYKAHPKRLQNR
jgi:hypothetical protein